MLADDLRELAIAVHEFGALEAEFLGTFYRVHAIESCNGQTTFVVDARCECAVTEGAHWCEVDDDERAQVVLKALHYEVTA